MTKVSHIFGATLSPQLGYALQTFGNKWIGLHFGRFFHGLIWSPCSPPKS
jgi:hypothetical protein